MISDKEYEDLEELANGDIWIFSEMASTQLGPKARGAYLKVGDNEAQFIVMQSGSNFIGYGAYKVGQEHLLPTFALTQWGALRNAIISWMKGLK